MDYHKPSDDWDKINYDGASKVAQMVAFTTLDLMNTSNRPTFKETKMTSMGGAKGRVQLGIMPNYAQSNEEGVLVDDVVDGKPAQASGIKGGDRIIQMGATPIQNLNDLMDVLSKAKPDEEMEIIVLRNKEKVTLKVKYVAR